MINLDNFFKPKSIAIIGASRKNQQQTESFLNVYLSTQLSKMLHNYCKLLNEYLGDYTKKVHGRGLVGKVPLSQKSIAVSLKELEKKGLLKSDKKGNIKFFGLNLLNPEIKDVLTITEIDRKIEFLRKHRKIANIFNKDHRVIGVFGSYAKDTQTKDSDIDLFIIGKKIKGDYDKKGKIFDLKISIKYFTETIFRKLAKDKDPLIKEIIEKHVLIFGIERFISIIWEDYYGFN
ncbi:nucleotidyltransferase domain-containing protein [Candidatus Woesearchaeota archaeon]|nr:nucleotidyltransferase domain-containing protein [Candidatus Woesearchaeota archaeon]